jgi:hypothetical protein
MYSIKQLLEIHDPISVSTSKTSEDPETGRITWDVQYNIDFQNVLDDMQDLVVGLQKAAAQTNTKDETIIKSIEAIKKIKTALIRHIHKNYPGTIK